MTESVRHYLRSKFIENGINLSVRDLSESEMFYYMFIFKEGMDLPFETAEQWFKYAKDIIIIRKNQGLEERIKELQTGEINLGDFENGEQLAKYLKVGTL